MYKICEKYYIFMHKVYAIYYIFMYKICGIYYIYMYIHQRCRHTGKDTVVDSGRQTYTYTCVCLCACIHILTFHHMLFLHWFSIKRESPECVCMYVNIVALVVSFKPVFLDLDEIADMHVGCERSARTNARVRPDPAVAANRCIVDGRKRFDAG